jgi:hypothetical protein
MAKENKGKQLNIYIGPDDMELYESFERIIKATRSDKSKTIKFLIKTYIRVMEPRVSEIESALEKALLEDFVVKAVVGIDQK